MASCWPTYVSCKNCKSIYTAEHGHVIGVIYVLILIPLMLLPFFVSNSLGVEDQGIYRKPAIAPVIVLFGPVLIYFIAANILGRLLVNRFNLKLKKTNC